ncbi:hypothetical protein BV898_12087 [Hypsibius exemplaris]|uniref:Uncharacterized protein n=1 Tax=Hypsibius exemplaris TaxID=2072580 RepID=A0A1W0WEY1_HYPEX|nr:hypothetical protein BV898_12087 [Hypsibius exemplaris]
MTNAFESLSTLTTNTDSGMLEARSVFKRLYLEKNIQLKRFPWEALTYVSSSLEGVKIDISADGQTA